MAGSTGLEPAASAVTGQRSNQLNYDPAFGYAGLAETGINTSSGAGLIAVLIRTNSIVTDSCRTHESHSGVGRSASSFSRNMFRLRNRG
jgi:hypothetical protein